ncbi:SET and MYND domain-containing protein 4-like [Aphidius gifuensis]|uniref:SET and MYND domain-containing protein 4-like n=1 Tax=Aphidius gifuensis TaxID=684658 RepID=UPI001CDCF9DB|nr:SET and MYND domain-containing protein 4-like [Aphidius gifuensis]
MKPMKNRSSRQHSAECNDENISKIQSFYQAVNYVLLQQLQVNLFQTQIDQMRKITTFKDIKLSQKLRKKGNTMYELKNNGYINSTITCYTSSIACAPVGSTELSLAYANRSAVLFKARLYEDCLLDIERAIKAGYPDNLKAKLFLRQSFCFRVLKQNSTIESSISLANVFQWLPNMIDQKENLIIAKNMINNYSKITKKLGKSRVIFDCVKYFPTVLNDNPKIHGASDAVTLKITNENKQCVIATRDIDPGEFIFAEQSFARIIEEDKRHKFCWHCSAECFAGVPCERCQNVIFCSSTCRDAAAKEYHDIECPVLNILVGMKTSIVYQFAAKIFIKMFKRFKCLTEFKDYVNNIELSASKVKKPDDKFDGSQYETFHNLECSLTDTIDCSVAPARMSLGIALIFAFYTDIFGKKLTLKRFLQNKWVVFVGGLILKYSFILRFHMFHHIHSVFPLNKIIKHSCDFNVAMNHFNSTASLFAIKPIKKGQQISIVKGLYYFYNTKAERQDSLSNLMTNCQCIACKNNWPIIEDMKLCREIIPAEQYNRLLFRNYLVDKVLKEENKQEAFKIIKEITEMIKIFHKKLPENIPYRELVSLQITLLNTFEFLTEPTVLND